MPTLSVSLLLLRVPAFAFLTLTVLAGPISPVRAEAPADATVTPSGEAGAESGDEEIFSMVGTWRGANKTISDKKGLREWTKTIHITEQTDRRFRGYFTYSAGTKAFFGVIYPGDESFTWVASDSKGYNHGRILDDDRITACYVEPGAEATAGCADLKRISRTPEPMPKGNTDAQ